MYHSPYPLVISHSSGSQGPVKIVDLPTNRMLDLSVNVYQRVKPPFSYGFPMVFPWFSHGFSYDSPYPAVFSPPQRRPIHPPPHLLAGRAPDLIKLRGVICLGRSPKDDLTCQKTIGLYGMLMWFNMVYHGLLGINMT